MTLQDFKDDFATNLYGMTQKEAWDQDICIKCRQPPLPRCPGPLDMKEYLISALCGICFDEITKEPG